MNKQTTVHNNQNESISWKWHTPFIADGITILLHLLLGHLLLGRFHIAPTDIPDFALQTDETVQLRILDGDAFINLLILIVLYLCFLIGIFIIRKLDGIVNPFWHQNRPLAIASTLLFGLCLTGAMTEITAFFDNIDTVQQMGEVSNGYIVMFTPAIFIFLSLLYFFLLTVPSEIIYKQSKIALGGLLAINMMMTGVVNYVVGAAERISSSLTDQSLFLSLIMLLVILFTYPRIMYATRTKQPISILPYIVMIIVLPIISLFIHSH